MRPGMFRDLMSMATALVVMQRLESRHAILKRLLAFKRKSLPMTASAAMRRRQNGDLQLAAFRNNLTDLLAALHELHPGSWQCKTQLIERIAQLSGYASHDTLLEERAQKDAFCVSLAQAAAASSDKRCSEVVIWDPSMQREHVRATLKKNHFYAIQGYLQPGVWCMFRVINTNPGSNMFLQRAVHIPGCDATWLRLLPDAGQGGVSKLDKFKVEKAPAAQDWKDCIAVEMVAGPDGDMCTAERPPTMVAAHRVEVAAMSIPKMFGNGCDVLSLHEYKQAFEQREREREREALCPQSGLLLAGRERVTLDKRCAGSFGRRG